MMDLRELMIDAIKEYGWLDFQFAQTMGKKQSNSIEYEKWLKKLSDKDLLLSYNRVSIHVLQLD